MDPKKYCLCVCEFFCITKMMLEFGVEVSKLALNTCSHSGHLTVPKETGKFSFHCICHFLKG